MRGTNATVPCALWRTALCVSELSYEAQAVVGLPAWLPPANLRRRPNRPRALRNNQAAPGSGTTLVEYARKLLKPPIVLFERVMSAV